jgi:hypothetical protein
MRRSRGNHHACFADRNAAEPVMDREPHRRPAVMRLTGDLEEGVQRERLVGLVVDPEHLPSGILRPDKADKCRQSAAGWLRHGSGDRCRIEPCRRHVQPFGRSSHLFSIPRQK